METGTLTFVDMTEDAGIDLRRWATSATAVDLTGDNEVDLYVTCIGPDVLLRNDGHGHFTDITAAAGIDVPGWSTCAAPGDIDCDGDLDLYIARYIDWDFSSPPPPTVTFRGEQVIAGPAGLPPQTDVLLINNGDGTFRDIDATAGIPPAFGLNAVMLDVDGDMQLEVLVGNDGMSNNLLVLPKTHAPRFRDEAKSRGFATNMSGAEQATMGLAVGDTDQSGTPDIISTNFSSDTNTLLITDGAYFVDRTNVIGLGPPTRSLLGWTTRLLDLDHDGDEDLITLNGPRLPPMPLKRPWRVSGDNRHSFSEGTATDSPALRLTTAGSHSDALTAQQPLEISMKTEILTSSPPNLMVRSASSRNQAEHPTRRGIVLDLSNEPLSIGHRFTIKAGGEIQHRWHTPGTDFQGWSAPQIHFSIDSRGVLSLDGTDAYDISSP